MKIISLYDSKSKKKKVISEAGQAREENATTKI
jgi:hypothetical protein